MLEIFSKVFVVALYLHSEALAESTRPQGAASGCFTHFVYFYLNSCFFRLQFLTGSLASSLPITLANEHIRKNILFPFSILLE